LAARTIQGTFTNGERPVTTASENEAWRFKRQRAEIECDGKWIGTGSLATELVWSLPMAMEHKVKDFCRILNEWWGRGAECHIPRFR